MKTSGIYSLLFIAILFLSGIIGNNFVFVWICNLIFSLALLFVWFRNKSIEIPPTFKYYCLFMALFSFSLSWSVALGVSLKHLLHFLSGGLIWLLFYNIENHVDPKEKGNIFAFYYGAVVVTGLFFGIIFLVRRLFGIYGLGSYDLINYTVRTLDHHLVGDYWVPVIGVVLVTKASIKHSNFIKVILLLLGILILVLAQSRSAIVSLGFVSLYLMFLSKSSKLKLLLRYLIVILLSLILFVGVNKRILVHRLFYLQAIPGVITHPLGVGFGSFGEISSNPDNHIFGISDYSGVADNLILEVVVGMGLLGISFIYWIYSYVSRLKYFNDSHRFPTALVIFASLGMNFMFNYSYLLPVFLWTWFASMGAIDRSLKEASLLNNK